MSDLVALLGDLHVGSKGDDEWTHENIYQTLKWFTDKCKADGVTICIQAGDFFDVRKHVTQKTLKYVRERIIPLFQDTFDMTYVLVGNHDIPLLKSVEISTPREVLGGVRGFTVVDKIQTVQVGLSSYDICPWIVPTNEEEIRNFIKNSKSEFCVGHFELGGNFYYYPGLKADGEDPEFLEKYSRVFSGHYHCISSYGNVQYVGTPLGFTLGDADDSRGFWYHDPVSGEATFHQNPITYHHKVYFDADTWKYTEKDLKERYENKTVKLIIEKSHSDINKKANIDKVLDFLEQIVHELKFEYTQDLSIDSSDSMSDTIGSLEIMREYVSGLDESDEIKERVLKIISGLYSEVVSSE